MHIATSEEDIRKHAEGPGSMDCALKAFRQGKKVLIVNPLEDPNATADEILNQLGLKK